MRLKSEFIRLPLSFDIQRLAQEAQQFSEYEWDYHPQRYDGNTALNLVSKNGGRSDAYVGKMQATPALEKCPYIRQVMASFGTVIGRSRFMRLAPGKGVPAHSDTDYTWRNRVRIHIPIVTDPAIVFSSMATAEKPQVDVHKRAGDAWIFDNWREHAVSNEAQIHRIHLVIDTVGTAKFWRLADQGWDPSCNDNASQADWDKTIKHIDFDRQVPSQELIFEKYNLVPVRSPDEVETLVSDFLSEIDPINKTSSFAKVKAALIELCRDWRGLWAQYLDTPDGIDRYLASIEKAKREIHAPLQNVFLKSNGAPAHHVISNWLDLAVDKDVIRSDAQRTNAASGKGYDASSCKTSSDKTSSYKGKIPEFDSPVFIVAAPRSGSTMLFEALKFNKDLWTIGDEAHQEIESIKRLNPSNRGFDSNRLSESDFSDDIGEQLIDAFMHRIQNSRCAPYADMPPEFQPSAIRFLEKTPKNALRIPFFRRMFPDAKFIYLHRQAEPNIGSMMDAWESGKFVTYDQLPEWKGLPWSLLLVDDWRKKNGRALAEIAAFQWAQTNTQILDDLESEIFKTTPQSVHCLSYEELLENPFDTLKAVCRFMQIPFGPKMQSYARTGFPNSKYSLSQPKADKWLRHQDELQGVKAEYVGVQRRISEFHNRCSNRLIKN